MICPFYIYRKKLYMYFVVGCTSVNSQGPEIVPENLAEENHHIDFLILWKKMH
jgi:hypothetical protein